MATQHLIDKGHTRIACITGPLDKTPARLRLEGYLSAMERAGSPFLMATASPAISNLTVDLKQCRNCWRKSCARRRCLSVTMRWHSGYQALYQAGLRVPDDMAIVGYDDIELAPLHDAAADHFIHQPKDELGELAIDVLIHRMAQPTLQQLTSAAYSCSDGTRFGLALLFVTLF